MPDVMGRQIGALKRPLPNSPNAPKPKRQPGARGSRRAGSKPDVFTNPDARGDAVFGAIYGALRPLDEIAMKMENKWGKDRLETLVTPETASKFRAVFERLNLAIDEGDGTKVAREAGILYRGWIALDEEASRLGQPTLPITVWSYTGERGEYLIGFTEEDRAGTLEHVDKEQAPRVLSIEMLIRIYESSRLELVREVLEHFPKAKITDIKPHEEKAPDTGAGLELFETPRAKGLDDEIPF
jgi:hypothetical protein